MPPHDPDQTNPGSAIPTDRDALTSAPSRESIAPPTQEAAADHTVAPSTAPVVETGPQATYVAPSRASAQVPHSPVAEVSTGPGVADGPLGTVVRAEASPAATFAPSPGHLVERASWPTPAPASQTSTTVPGYDIAGELGRGGMGVVFRGTDTILGREVAIKVLHQQFTPGSGVANRFIDEARITAQLQHPGIPAVHALGTLPDGRPFLAMKLIRGQTLSDLLKARPGPTHDQGRFVAVFEQICQALAFAHAHHVIHRDLKPANIMVGGFGEVQVLDWGLAKVLGGDRSTVSNDPEATTGAQHTPVEGADDQFTQAGSVLGTPAYMPPEQASGAIDQIDARSDVFSLGAVLAVILTGQPPFAGGTAETTRVKAAQGEVAECFSRLDASGADPELAALCKRCLAPAKADRPADAGAIAQAVAALRAAADERARQAELDRVKAEGDRVATELRVAEQRRRARLRRALAAAVTVLVLSGGAFAWYADRQAGEARAADLRRQLEDEQRASAERDRHGRNAEAVTSLLDQAEAALRAGDEARAGVLLVAAEKRATEGGAEELGERLDRLRADRAVLRQLDAIDQFRWTPVGNKLPDATEVAERYRTVLAGFGVDLATIESAEITRRVSASVVQGRLIAAFDRLLRADRSPKVRAVLRTVDPHPFRDAVRDLVGPDRTPAESAALAQLLGQDQATEQPPSFAAFMGESAAVPIKRRRVLLGIALQRRPGDLGLLMALGNTYPVDQQEGAEERARWYQAAVAVAPINAAAHNNLGVALRRKGDLDGAIIASREAIRIDPNFALAHDNLGNARVQKGDIDGAIACYREAIRIDPKAATAHCNLGLALSHNRDSDGAIAEYREAIRTNPKHALAHNRLGNALVQKGELERAIGCYREAIHLDPRDANPHNNLAAALNQKGDIAGVIAELQEVIRIDPKYPLAHTNLGVAHVLRGDLDGAILEFREAIRIDPKLALTHAYLGMALGRKGDLDEAIAAYKESLRLDPKQADAVANLPHAERLRALTARLPRVLAGTDRPNTPAETVEFAKLCEQPFQKLYAGAAQLYERAFAADSKLATDVVAAHRYDAACDAARAACGDGVDAPVSPPDRAALRAKALGWLRADLTHWRKQATSARPAERAAVAAKMSHWLHDSDLAGVRGAFWLATLPADEVKAWQTLWADVRATRDAALRPPPPLPVAPAPRLVTR